MQGFQCFRYLTLTRHIKTNKQSFNVLEKVGRTSLNAFSNGFKDTYIEQTFYSIRLLRKLWGIVSYVPTLFPLSYHSNDF